MSETPGQRTTTQSAVQKSYDCLEDFIHGFFFRDVGDAFYFLRIWRYFLLLVIENVFRLELCEFLFLLYTVEKV